PLSAIKLYSAALEKGIYTDPQKQKETARSIGDKADEIEHLVNEIMRSGTEDIVRFEVKDAEFYLSEVISRISVYYRDKLTGTRFTVGEYNDCIISGDPDRLEEVLQNIIENAVKYGDGHSISLSFADEEDCRLITVTNSGCTLPEEELAHIFDSFWRGSNVGSRNGNGLGLYICRQLTRAMGGDIYAEIRGDEMNVTVVCRK
ncbi:MAG: HAMP domain-containing histidine kinase, partial [Ruminiclostridium sp.]|nr:HAMP domain-containing histidine kinase [Ruminiclostridium sp.]